MSFEKDFFKLMNNSVFGKTMENLRKRCDVKLVTDHKRFLKMVSKPTYIEKKQFTEDLVAVHKIRETLVLNRPAYVGMCILDLSKTVMYDSHCPRVIKFQIRLECASVNLSNVLVISKAYFPPNKMN